MILNVELQATTSTPDNIRHCSADPQRFHRARRSRIMDRRRFATVLVALTAACAPATPRIDGVPGAPPSPSTLWPVPPEARTPAPSPATTNAPEATGALTSDATNAGAALALPDVVDLALRRNPATHESWMNARATADTYAATRGALLLPSLDATVNAGRSANASTTGAALGSGQTIGGTTNSTLRSQLATSAFLSYLLFDLGGRSGSIEEAKQRAVAADLTHNATVHDVILQVESALFSYLADRALRDAQAEAVNDAAADTAAAAERLRVGVATLAELLQTKTALAQARFQLATVEGDLQSAHGNLATAMGCLPTRASTSPTCRRVTPS
jgi:outer membrane protein